MGARLNKVQKDPAGRLGLPVVIWELRLQWQFHREQWQSVPGEAGESSLNQSAAMKRPSIHQRVAIDVHRQDWP
jgi:hypothetical protein